MTEIREVLRLWLRGEGCARSSGWWLRWTAAGMLAAEAQFRRVKGYKLLPQLLAALDAATVDAPGQLDLPAPVTT